MTHTEELNAASSRSSTGPPTPVPRPRDRLARLLSLVPVVCVAALAATVLLAAPSPAAAGMVTRSAIRAFEPRTVDPAYPVQSLSSLAVAPDGSGGLAYMASVSGAGHLFVTRLQAGTLSAPIELDARLAGTTSQPVLAAGPHGELVAAFVNGGNLYVSEAVDGQHRFSDPAMIAGHATNPALSLDKVGQGYLAFTQAAGAGNDVQVDFWGGAHWHRAQPGPLNVTPADDAGTGAGRPAVAAAHDGVGVVTWGENGHVYARRVWDTMTSTETLRLDPATYHETGAGGVQTDWSWQQAGSPAVATDGDSTYIDVAFQETMGNGVDTADRVFLARLVAERLDSVNAVDGLTTLGTQGGASPQVVMNENGYGLVTDVASADGTIIGTPLGVRGTLMHPLALSGADAIPPDPVSVAEGGAATMTAWAQPYNGDPADPQVVFSYSSTLGSFPAPTQISSAGAGPVDYANGLLAAGDGGGDGLIAWLQGAPGSESIQLGGVLVPPGPPAIRRHAPITTHVRAVLGWGAGTERFGPVTYTVALNGRTIARTAKLSVRLRARLARGSYRWRVTATNQVGQSATSSTGTLVVKRYRRPRHKHHRHTVSRHTVSRHTVSRHTVSRHMVSRHTKVSRHAMPSSAHRPAAGGRHR